jgi:parallel beta-helix repeat protein
MRKPIAIAVLLAALSASPALAGKPRHAPVSCGQVITSDTRLTRDLVDCPGTALTIGADGVDLDLGGHLVDGVNAPGSEGVAVDGHRRVTIAHGAIREFRVNGVGLRQSPGARVSGLSIKRIGDGGVEGEPVSAGVFALESPGLEVTGNRVSNHVTAYQADGIVVIRSPRTVVARNDSSRNAWNGMVLDDSPDSRIVANRTWSNFRSGILVAVSPSVYIARNSSGDHPGENTAGILVLSTENGEVVGNRASGNAYSGISLENGSTGNTVAGNRVRGGGDGITVIGSTGNRVSWNRISDAGYAGIYVSEDSSGNRLDWNFATRSGLSGLLIEGSGNSLARNTATFNHEHGIHAPDGTVDGGGNRAFGNTLSPQCVGVACGA